jgi:chromosome segregation ATPase
MFKEDQETWDIIVAQCEDGSYRGINVASDVRSRAIMNVDGELKALRLQLTSVVAELERQLIAARDKAAQLQERLEAAGRVIAANREEAVVAEKQKQDLWADIRYLRKQVRGSRKRAEVAEARAETAEAALDALIDLMPRPWPPGMEAEWKGGKDEPIQE